MATPALRTQAYGQAVTSVAYATSTDVVIGDLLIVVYGSTNATTGITAAATANSGAQTVATLTLDKTISDGTRDLYVWSGIVTVVPTTLVTVTLTGAPTTGTRRLLVQSINPGTSQRWTATRLDRSATLTGTTGTSSWTIPWGTAGTSTQPQYSINAEVGNSLAPTCDPGDGTARTPYPGTSNNFQCLGFGWSTNTLQSVSNATWSLGGGNNKVAASLLYAVGDPVQGRGKSASKATGKFSVIKTASARGKNASKGSAPGYVYTSAKTASARGNNASKATLKIPPKTASGRGKSAADSYASAQHTATTSGRGKAASKATAGPLIIRPTPARGNAASKATGKYTVTRRISARGNSATKATSNYTLVHRISARGNSAAAGMAKYFFAIAPWTASGRGKNATSGKGKGHVLYEPPVLSDFTSTLIADIGTTSTVATNIGTTFTYILNDGASSTIVENNETTRSFAVTDGHSTTLET